MGAVLPFLFDRLTNIMSGKGTTADRRVYDRYAFIPVDAAEAEAWYRGTWLGRKIVDILPFDMTREGRDWQAEALDIEKLEAEERRLKLWFKLLRALTLARLYGGGGIVLGVGDTDPTQPIDPEAVGKGGLKYAQVYSRYQLNEGGTQRLDPEDPWFGQPDFFTIALSNGDQLKLHPSRVVSFIGQRPPEGSRYPGASWFWGDPLLQSIKQAVQNADTAQDGFAGLIDEAKVDILKIPDLTTRAATPEYETQLMTRLAAASAGKSTWRMLAIDAAEDWEQRQITWAGMPDMIFATLQVVCGAADVPITRLLGASPKGLQSDGGGEERDYQTMISAKQRVELAPSLEIIDDLLIRSALGSKPSDVYYEFAPLRQMDEKDAAAIEKQRADTVKVYSDTGLLPDQALQDIAKNSIIESGRWPGSEAAFEEAEKAIAADPSLDPLNQPDPAELALTSGGSPQGSTPFARDFNPNHVKSGEHGGEFTSKTGEAGGAREEVKSKPLDQAAKDAMARANEGKSIEQLRLEAATNQVALAKLGREMEAGLGVRFVQPPVGFEVKSAASIERKVRDENYDGPHQLRDISRASFVVGSPAQADSIVATLGARGQVYDRGWTREKKSGYLGRFVYLQHPNGGVSEVQLVPQGVAQLKMGENLQSNGIGHALYEIMRLPSNPMEVREAAARKARTLYSRALPKSFYKATP